MSSIGASRFRRVAVWGGGTAGSGIAQVAALAGLPVALADLSPLKLDNARKSIEFSLSRIAKKRFDGDKAKMKRFVDETVALIMFTTNSAIAAGNAELIIEAITEDVEMKKTLFAKLDKMAPKESVFASATSSLSITDLSTATARADRFVGLHFFSPVPMMKLVEVVKTNKVAPEVIERAVKFAVALGKVPVVCKDTKGFIVNRLLVPYQLEAARLVERGVATYEDVDTAMKLGCGYPMGPFELADSVGLDTLELIVKQWHAESPDNPLFHPAALNSDRVKAGKLGAKTGEGFYKYNKKGYRVN